VNVNHTSLGPVGQSRKPREFPRFARLAGALASPRSVYGLG
jgi:hypothetical protein